MTRKPGDCCCTSCGGLPAPKTKASRSGHAYCRIDLASRVDAGQSPAAQALGLKIFTSEMRSRRSDFAVQVLGVSGLLTREEAGAPLHGNMELLYRRAPLSRLGVGANEVVQDVVAQRGLAVPRAR